MEIVSSDEESVPRMRNKKKPSHQKVCDSKSAKKVLSPIVAEKKKKKATKLNKMVSPPRTSRRNNSIGIQEDYPAVEVPAVSPRRKSSPRTLSRTTNITSIKKRKLGLLDSSDIIIDQVKKKIDFDVEAVESGVGVTPLQKHSVSFVLPTDENVKGSVARRKLKGPTGKRRGEAPQISVIGTKSPHENGVGARKSKRQHIPTSDFWLGLTCNKNIDLKHRNIQPEQSKKVETNKDVGNKKSEVNLATLKKKALQEATVVKRKEKNTHQSGNRVGKRNDDGNKKSTVNKVATPKKRALQEVKVVKIKDKTTDQSVCCANLKDVQFGSHGEGDTDGVLRASSLFLHDMEAEFIQLLPRGETGDLFSFEYNQFYTVLENEIVLNVSGELKSFDLHGQFHVCKGLSHKISNKSNKKSLLQSIKIHVQVE